MAELNLQLKIESAKGKLLNEIKGLQGVANANPIEIKLKPDAAKVKAELKSIKAEALSAQKSISSMTAATTKQSKTSTKSPVDDIDKTVKKITTANTKLNKALEDLRKTPFKGKASSVGMTGQVEAQINDIETLIKRVKEAQKELSLVQSGELGIDNVNLDNYAKLQKDVDGTLRSIENLKAEIKSASVETINANSRTIAYDKIGNRLTDYYARYGTQLRKNQKILNEFYTLQSRVSNMDFGSVNELNTAFAMFRTNARNAGVELDTFASKFSNTFGSRVRSALAGEGVFMMQSAMQDIIQNSIAVDTALTELKKVTDATDSEYEQFMVNASSRAQQLGATLKDTVNATADYARLGFDIPEATQLADSAIIYQNVADGVETMDEATAHLISTMQGFGIASEDSMSIVDKFNEVSNNYAVSAGDIGEMVLRSAASMSAAGNTLDETIALGTVANEVQQDADVVGTALKTMSMRLRGSKTDLESAGLTTSPLM